MKRKVRDNILTKVERVIRETMPELYYYAGDWPSANRHFDFGKFPAILNLLPAKMQVSFTPKHMKQTGECSFAIFDKVDMDATAEEYCAIVMDCAEYAAELILQLNDSKLFQTIENKDFDMSPLWNEMDVNVAGVIVNITLKEKQGIILCGQPIKSIFYEREEDIERNPE